MQDGCHFRDVMLSTGLSEYEYGNQTTDLATLGWASCLMPTVLHIMPKRVSAHYATIMLEAFAHFMPGLCRKFLKTPRVARRPLAAAILVHKKASAVKDWFTKGWGRVPEMDLAANADLLTCCANSTKFQYSSMVLNQSTFTIIPVQYRTVQLNLYCNTGTSYYSCTVHCTVLSMYI